MSRNPHATNLRHHKPKRIEDKRDAARVRFAVSEGAGIDDSPPRHRLKLGESIDFLDD